MGRLWAGVLVGEGVGVGAGVNEFFYYESKFKITKMEGGGGARVSEFFFTKNQNLKLCVEGGGGGWAGRRGEG